MWAFHTERDTFVDALARAGYASTEFQISLEILTVTVARRNAGKEIRVLCTCEGSWALEACIALDEGRLGPRIG